MSNRKSVNISNYSTEVFSVKICLLLIVVLVLPNLLNSQNSDDFEKIKGVSFTGPEHKGLGLQTFDDIKKINAEWITFVPEVILNRATLELRPDSENHYWGRTIEGNIEGMKLAKEAGLKIMLKPQMILDAITNPSGIFSDLIKLEDQGGKIVVDKSNNITWRGEFEPDNEEDWVTWETSYKNYILQLADIAQQLNIEIFCIGTELRESVKNRPDFWVNLITDVRKIYDGRIIYSANWDDYKNIKFWKHLDYIGVNSYFPISLLPTPTVKGAERNWKFFKKGLRKLSKKHKKQILITEFGYRNVSFAGIRPWIHDDGKSKVNNEAQVNLYKAFFNALWNEKWLVGGFSWNWDAIAKEGGNTDFSVQNKPAQQVLADWYGRSN